MPVTNQHRFLDEWILTLLRDTPGLTPELIASWREQKRTFLSQSVVDQGLRSFEELGEAVLKRFRIGYGDPDPEAIDRALLSVVSEKLCRRHNLVPRDRTGHALSILMANPMDTTAQEEVEWAAGRSVVPLFCLPDHLDRLLLGMLTPDAVVYDLLQRLEVEGNVEILGTESEDEGGEPKEPGQVRAPVIRLANAIIADAVTRGASDIHIEHEEQATVVRYRIDGLLRKMMVLPRYVGAGPLVSRIKIMAGLDLAERRRPQDGRAKLRVNGTEIGLRVSTLPTRMGEKIVFRILDERSAHVPLDRLGFHGDVLARLENLISKEEGILLVTGPTGSGKTTTLYSVLNRLAGDEVNIVTVEDPVEYRLQSISQVQVNEKQGFTFASVLRSILRQDPDIIMVGEIRDAETANIACQAALTGHMVLSTLHTNDTVTAVARLVDMGVERFKLASGLNGVTAQRLVRRVCPSCSAPLDAAEVSPALDSALRRRGLNTTLQRSVGCPACEHTGYKGRLSIVELLEIPEVIRDVIAGGATTEEIREAAKANGCLHTMTDDVLRHLADGHTTLEEVEAHLVLDERVGQEREATVREVATVHAPTMPTPASGPGGPMAARPMAIQPGATGTPSPAARSLAVLAVSDETAKTLLTEALAEGGVQSSDAESGQSAVALVAGLQPTALVIGPPAPGLDVPGLVRLIRGVLGMRDLPILALVASEVDADALLEAGADDFLVLPLRRSSVRARLRSLLGKEAQWPAPEEVMRPKTPAVEAERLADLRATNILDTQPEERFDALTRKAAEYFGVPISLVSLVDADRQWFKSHHGTDDTQTPRDISFCGHAVLGDAVFVVEDAYLDARFVDNPLVTGDSKVRFYAGYPLKGPQGRRIGSFCVIDHEPRHMSAEDLAVLVELGHQVEAELAR